MTAQAIAALAESCRPYGYESFRPLLEDLLEGIKTMSGKCLGAYLNALGYIIPLMGENANKLIGTVCNDPIDSYSSYYLVLLVTLRVLMMKFVVLSSK